MNKFNNLKCSISHLNDSYHNFVVLPSYSSALKNLQFILQILVLKSPSNQSTKLKYLLKNFILIGNQCGIYFMSCSSCDVDYIDQTRRRLEYRVNEYCYNAYNQEIFRSSIPPHCWSYNHCFEFSEANIIFPSSCSSHLDFYKAFYFLKTSKVLLMIFTLSLSFLMP